VAVAMFDGKVTIESDLLETIAGMLKSVSFVSATIARLRRGLD
jgi:hypothetical protein